MTRNTRGRHAASRAKLRLRGPRVPRYETAPATAAINSSAHNAPFASPF
jgi:hypothetical protein